VPLVLASVQDDLYDWLTREAPDYLRALASGWSDLREAFATYLRTGDQGALFSGPYRRTTGGVPAGAPFFGFRDGTGRHLAPETITQLRRYFAARSMGITRLCWLSEDPNDDTPQPIGAAQLHVMLLAMPGGDDLVALAVALRPLLQALAVGTLPFGDKPHRVVVVTRQGRLTRGEAIAEVHRRGLRVGRDGGVSETEFCNQVVAAAGVPRGRSGFSDVAILRDAREAQKKRG
jgi:hypothetical protein